VSASQVASCDCVETFGTNVVGTYGVGVRCAVLQCHRAAIARFEKRRAGKNRDGLVSISLTIISSWRQGYRDRFGCTSWRHIPRHAARQSSSIFFSFDGCAILSSIFAQGLSDRRRDYTSRLGCTHPAPQGRDQFTENCIRFSNCPCGVLTSTIHWPRASCGKTPLREYVRHPLSLPPRISAGMRSTSLR
jgi:hypothetical protein